MMQVMLTVRFAGIWFNWYIKYPGEDQPPPQHEA